MNSARGAVLVLTQEGDVTADVVVDKLGEDDVPVYRFDTGEFPLHARITATLNGNGRPAVKLAKLDGEAMDLGDVRSVWYRRPTNYTFPNNLTHNTLQFVQGEARQAFSGLLLGTGALWMNEPRMDSLAGLKPLQLRVASDLGFRIPRTLITNDPEEAKAFLETPGEHIYKRLAQNFLYTEDGELTAFETVKVTPEHLSAIHHVRVTPCQFQEFVEKDYELRVTVVGRKVFAARVESRDLVDWRTDTDLTWSPYEIPADVSDKLLQFMDHFGLVFGAFDLIRSTDGSYVFIEVNPSGQWAWFDDEITLPIRDEIARVLREGAVA